MANWFTQVLKAQIRERERYALSLITPMNLVIDTGNGQQDVQIFRLYEPFYATLNPSTGRKFIYNILPPE